MTITKDGGNTITSDSLFTEQLKEAATIRWSQGYTWRGVYGKGTIIPEKVLENEAAPITIPTIPNVLDVKRKIFI